MSYIHDNEFDIIPEYYKRVMLLNAYKSICEVNRAWDWLKNCNEESFAYSDSPYVAAISNKMEELGFYDHSGSSFGWTMRQMETIAKHGRTKFFSQFYSNDDGAGDGEDEDDNHDDDEGDDYNDDYDEDEYSDDNGTEW